MRTENECFIKTRQRVKAKAYYDILKCLWLLANSYVLFVVIMNYDMI